MSSRRKSPKPRPAKVNSRTCAFCGATPVSKEHVYRQKWGKVYPNVPRLTHEWTIEYANENVLGSRVRPPYTRRPFEQKVGAACRACNNGWMNDLENEAEAELMALFDCVPHDVTPEASTAVARWVAKTVVVIEQLSKTNARAAVSDEQVAALRDGRVPPGFFTYMYTLEPTGEIYHRSSPSVLRELDDQSAIPGIDNSWGLVSIHFRRVLFVCAHFATREMCTLLGHWGLARLFGPRNQIETERAEPWPASRRMISSSKAHEIHELARVAVFAGLKGVPVLVAGPSGTIAMGAPPECTSLTGRADLR